MIVKLEHVIGIPLKQEVVMSYVKLRHDTDLVTMGDIMEMTSIGLTKIGRDNIFVIENPDTTLWEEFKKNHDDYTVVEEVKS